MVETVVELRFFGWDGWTRFAGSFVMSAGTFIETLFFFTFFLRLTFFLGGEGGEERGLRGGAVRAGDVSFHSGWTIHGAGPNQSASDREAIAVVYVAKGKAKSKPEETPIAPSRTTSTKRTMCS